MPSPLASIYSTADSFKRSLLDMLSNPVEAAQQIVGNANDRAGILNQLTAEAAQEGRNGGPLFGPKSQQLAGTLADAYNPVGMFIGPSSKLWNSDMAFEAQKMLKRGMSPQEVWQQTGTARAPDGLLRQEISDVGSEFQTTEMMRGRAKALRDQIAENKDRLAASNAYPDLFPTALKAAQKELRQENKNIKGLVDALQQPERYGAKADLAFKHDRMFEAYPELRNITVKQGYDRPNVFGTLSQDATELGVTKQALARGGDQARSTSLHEFQHAIQELEDFARGGNIEMVQRAQNVADVKISDINELLSANAGLRNTAKTQKELQSLVEEYNDLLAERDKLVAFKLADPYEAYRALTGEAEARLTQLRRNLTDEQRRQYYPFEEETANYGNVANPYGLDVPLKSLWNVNKEGAFTKPK